jgi:hypothetical protein
MAGSAPVHERQKAWRDPAGPTGSTATFRLRRRRHGTRLASSSKRCASLSRWGITDRSGLITQLGIPAASGRPSHGFCGKLMLPMQSSRATRRCCATSFFRKRASGWSFDLISNYIKRLRAPRRGIFGRPDDSAAAYRGRSIVRCTAQRLIWSHDGAVERARPAKPDQPTQLLSGLSRPHRSP